MSDGFTKLLPIIGTFLTYGLCFVFLSISLKKIPISVAYAIWAAAGIIIVSAMGILIYKESVSVLKIISLLFIVVGVIGVNLSGVSH